MVKAITITAAAALLAATPALSQSTPPSPTKALVNIIIAEQYCALGAPPAELVVGLGEDARRETGLDNAQLVEAGYAAAREIANAYRSRDLLVGFCVDMTKLYAREGWGK
jgi:hypothetical protein